MKFNHHIPLTILSLLLLCSSLFAQPRQKHPDHEALRKDIQTYTQTEIVPVLQPQREKLDRILSAEAKMELNEIRTELMALRAQHKANRPSREERKSTDFSPTPEQREQFRQSMKSRRLLMTRAWAIADEYEVDIHQLLSEIEPQVQEWREGIRSIKESHRPEGMLKGKPAHGGQMGNQSRPHHNGHRRGHRGKSDLLQMVQSPVRFLLWDHTKQPPEHSLQENGEISVYPNPSTHSTSLSYETKLAGTVKIQLINPQGNIVKTMNYQNLEAGKHTEQIETHQLDTGVYIIRIQSGKEIQTQKLVVE